MISLLHTADWQLGKPFAGVADVQKRALVQNERFAVIKRIGDRTRIPSLVLGCGLVLAGLGVSQVVLTLGGVGVGEAMGAGGITDGQTIAIRHTSSADYGTTVTTTLTIGGVVLSACWWLSAKFKGIDDKLQSLDNHLRDLPCEGRGCTKDK